jgi:nicotinate dehydrogenase subunit A
VADTYRLDVNGRSRDVEAEPGTSLLLVLRNALGLTGAKFGCGQGLCGACTVWLDGFPTPSCDQPVEYVGDRAVRTVEDLSDDGDPGPLQRSFLDGQAAQCGYCIPGIIMAAAALLATDPKPSEGDIRTALAGNLCRCGSHGRILRAIQRVAAQPERTL